MRKFKILLFAFVSLIAAYFGARTIRTISVVDKTIILKTDHFVISYHGIFTDDALTVANTLEESYARIRVDLNDADHESIRVFIHATQEDFNKATGLLYSQATGTSRGPNEFHILWTNWFNSIFPIAPEKIAVHEFTHCVQLNILIMQAKGKIEMSATENFEKYFEEKFAQEYPQWFWEALSDYEAGIVNSLSVKYGMWNNPTLKNLNESNQIYHVGYTIIEYIIKRWGGEKIPILISSYVDIENSLGVGESEFEKGWIDFVNQKY